jgi:hypothetical protein
MATNPYFKDYSGEQRLLNDLTIETIKAMGRDFIYLPREYLNIDMVFGEDPKSSFKNGYSLEMYVLETLKFGGNRDIITKFGIAITDRLTMQFAKTRFFDEVTSKQSEITRPREGDLIYYPLSGSIFEINFVEDEQPFYQFGTLTTFTVTCELFTYSHEEMDTGIPEIDDVFIKRTDYATMIGLTGFSISGVTHYIGGERVTQKNGSALVIEEISSAGKPNTLYLANITGAITSGMTLAGVESGAVYTAFSTTTTNINITKDPLNNALRNNDTLQKQSFAIEFSSDNPFSENC